MASGVIEMSDAAWRELKEHLLPPNSQTEEGAFILARHDATDEQEVVFQHIQTVLLTRNDYEFQESDYLELTDATKGRLIKLAHDQQAALVEFHSHIGPYPACLSPSDMAGLSEFAPHVIWRLKGRPYAAVVVTKSGIDGLAWLSQKAPPVMLKSILVGNQHLKATGLSFRISRRRTYEQI